jgi:hypothetical protein
VWRAAAMRPDPKVVHDANDVQLELYRVVIATWSGCAKEAAFLVAEFLDRLDTLIGKDVTTTSCS